MPPAGRKRPRPAKETSEITRPNPPPPPPAALVKLLQRDSKVLEYFQALQSNLDFDVKKWKTRARALEVEREELRAELQEWKTKSVPLQPASNGEALSARSPTKDLDARATLGQEFERRTSESKTQNTVQELDASNATKHTKKEDGKDDDDFQLEFSSSDEEGDEKEVTRSKSAAAPNIHNKHTSQSKPSFGIYKKNTSLNLSSSDDNDDDDDGGAFLRKHNSATESPPVTSDNQAPSYSLSPDVQHALEHLSKVLVTMEDMGILFVDRIQMGKPMAAEGDKSSDDEEPSTLIPEKYKLIRRDNQDIAIDVLQFVRALTRVKHSFAQKGKESDFQRYFYPFMASGHGNNFQPCYERPRNDNGPLNTLIEHPAVAGVEKLLSCLCYMDVFCPALDALDVDDRHKSGAAELVMSVSESKAASSLITKYQPTIHAMKDRKSFVNEMLYSLEGEMIQSWPVLDRTSRLLTTATHMDSVQNKVDSGNATVDGDGEDNAITSARDAKVIPFGNKNFVRLSALMERCILAKIVTSLYLFRGDPQKAMSLLGHYILATVPALSLEEHPKLSPILSFCILEAILTASPPSLGNEKASTRTLLEIMKSYSLDLVQEDWEALSCVLQATADIYKTRSASHLDDRIADMSRVEVAAFQRFWNYGGTSLSIESQSNWNLALQGILKRMLRVDDSSDRLPDRVPNPGTVCCALVLQGDANLIDNNFDIHLKRSFEEKLDVDSVTRAISATTLLAIVAAKKQLEIRQADVYRRIANTPMIISPSFTGSRTIQSYTREIVDKIVDRSMELRHPLVATALHCCQASSNGESIFQLVEWIIHRLAEIDATGPYSEVLPLLDSLEAASQMKAVRVINLNRRPDRWAAFTAQALSEGLSILRGVCNLCEDQIWDKVDGCEKLFGLHAIDGQGKAADVERRLVDVLGTGQEGLNKLVATHWVPNDLKPFDSDAPDSDEKVLISPSEKACAISHISCWKGVAASLSPEEITELSQRNGCNILRNPSLLRQRFLISGYASGSSLSGKRMDPTPVCVILEDDAILVDRFSDRLESLLEELPRDFHFCSIGYSRPKTAPLVPYSSQLSIPTSIWYLTGYILSLEGAKFLLQKLPVRGPVDSWIGLTIFWQNWDNLFGHALGVGVSTKPPQDPSLSPDKLRKIIRFHAFAATVPLCSQKVGNLDNVPSTGRNWRHRDTDVVYSGNSI